LFASDGAIVQRGLFCGRSAAERAHSVGCSRFLLRYRQNWAQRFHIGGTKFWAMAAERHAMVHFD
jgi:hypothetical protein